MTASSTSSVEQLADRFFEAIAGGDLEAVERIYAPDAVIWHNFDGINQSVGDNLRTLAWMVRTFAEIRYEDVERNELPDGFVQRHVLRATTSDGQTIQMPSCLFAKVADGRIARIEEYLDPAPVASLTRRDR